MMKSSYILIMLFLFQISCKEVKKNDNQNSIDNEKAIVKDTFFIKYFSAIDIPYFLDEDKDSIWNSKERIIDDKEFRSKYITKARARRSAIRKFSYSNYNGVKVPSPFKRYLSARELKEFNKDSINSFVILYELYKKRLQIINNLTKYSNSLTDNEIHELIQNSYRDSIYYKELAKNRFKNDSIKFSINRSKLRDSLQLVKYPIDSMLHFGPRPLGELIKRDQNYLNFYTKVGDSLTKKDKEKRKHIYDIWMYYLKLHPYVDADLSENYKEKLLPPIRNYKVLDNPILSTLINDNYEKEYSPINGNFIIRLPDINNSELYYTTTGKDYPIGCSTALKNEEDCCFSKEGYDCNSVGYLVLYNRNEEFASVIPAFILSDTQSYGFQLQFFYITDNTVHIYQGYSMYDWFVDENGEIDRYLYHKDGSTTNAKGYKSIGIAKAFEIEILNSREIKTKKIKK